MQTHVTYLDASRLNRRLTLKQRTLSQDASGQTVETWQTLRELWAEIRPNLSPGEVQQAGQRNALARYRVTIRFQPDLHITRGEHRFYANERQWRSMGMPWNEAFGQWQDRFLDIVDIVNPMTANEGLEIHCEEWAV